ncbi:MAG: hypothetical protein II883_09855, partial [Spirochaetales bacterium]|nr:hypothetical protein [Spirochaetales bacterium]
MHTSDWQDNGSKWWRTGIASNTWWIDGETATCNFNSDSFIRYLRFVANGNDEEGIDSIFAD